MKNPPPTSPTIDRSLFLDLFDIVHIPLKLGVAFLLMVGLGIRLLDLTDAPMDFNPTRQLRGAILARGLYYEQLDSADPETRQVAISLGGTIYRYEPPILESIVAATYQLIGGEYFWVARILNSIFWVIGGLALFALSRRAVSTDGAILALLFYLFLPFSVFASRSFQPDPFMTTWVVLFIYTAYRWVETLNWKWALTTAILAAITVLVKAFAVYLVAGVLVAITVYKFGLRKVLINRQVWTIIAISVIPSLYYYVISGGGESVNYVEKWVLALAPQLLKTTFYINWAGRIHTLINLVIVLISLASIWFSRSVFRALLIGLWVGYILYGLSLPHQITTHDYYHIQLVPIVALSLVPLAGHVSSWVITRTKIWQAISLGLVAIAVASSLWNVRVALHSVDYRSDADFWEYVGNQLPRNGRILALTQQYGQPLAYYGWKRVSIWPVSQEIKLDALRGEEEKEFEAYFAKRIEQYDYFLVTAFKQLKRQPLLEATLYSDYPILAEGGGFIIFDLRDSID